MKALSPFKFKLDPFAFVPACLLSAFTVISYSYENADSIALLVQNPRSTALSLLVFVVLTIFAYTLLAHLFRWLDAHQKKGSSETFAEVFKKRFIIYLVIVLVCWLPWLITNYPGTLRDDSIRQLFQTYGIEPYSNGNPLFDTWLFGVFWHFGDALGNRALGLYLYGVFQAICTAVGFSIMLCYIQRLGVPRLIVYLGLAACSLIIIFPLAAISMSKDSLNGGIYLIFLVMCAELCRTRGQAMRGYLFLLSFFVISVLLIASKRTMLYVALIVFIVFIIFLKHHRRKSILLFAAVLVVSYGFNSIFLPSVMKNNAPVEESPPSESSPFLVIPIQQASRVLAEKLPIDQSDCEGLSRLLDCEKAAQLYNPRRGDDSSFAIRDFTNSQDRDAFLAAWIDLGFKYPGVYSEALVNQVFGWFSPFWKIAFGYDLSHDVFDEAHQNLWNKYFQNDKDAEDFLAPLKNQKPLILSKARHHIEDWATCQYDTPLLIGMGPWCTWLGFVSFAYALRRKNVRALAVFSVPFGVLLSCLIGPMVLYWYAIPLFYGAPLLISIAFMKHENCPHQRSV